MVQETELDRRLRGMARRFADWRAPYEDLLQEARIAAWQAAGPAQRVPGIRDNNACPLCAAKWAILRYVEQERRQSHSSLDALEEPDQLPPLRGVDFAPALIDWLEDGAKD